MAMDDLFSALNMFKQGVQDLQTSRIINGANDQVQQIKASEASEAQKRSALLGLSQQLVGQLGSIGAPVSQIAQQAGAVAGPQYKTANEMHAAGLMLGDKSLLAASNNEQAFEQNPEYKKQLISAKAAMMNPLMLAKFQEDQYNHDRNSLTDLNKELDVSRASSRSVFGQGGQALQKAERVQALMGDPSRWNNLSDTEMTTVAEGVANVAKGGVATKEELEALLPGTSGSWQARAQQFLNNNPEPSARQQFAQRFSDMMNRETEVNKLDTLDDVLSRANGYSYLGNRSSQTSQQYKVTVASQLQKLGIPVKPEDVQIDPQKGVVVPQIEQVKQQAAIAQQATRKALVAINSPKASAQDKYNAQKILDAAGVSADMPASRAADLVRKKIMLKVFQ